MLLLSAGKRTFSSISDADADADAALFGFRERHFGSVACCGLHRRRARESHLEGKEHDA